MFPSRACIKPKGSFVLRPFGLRFANLCVIRAKSMFWTSLITAIDSSDGSATMCHVVVGVKVYVATEECVGAV